MRFTRTLIMKAAADWVRDISSGSNAQKLKLELQTFTEREMGSRAEKGLVYMHWFKRT